MSLVQKTKGIGLKYLLPNISLVVYLLATILLLLSPTANANGPSGDLVAARRATSNHEHNYNVDKIEKKITVIVNDEEPIVVSNNSNNSHVAQIQRQATDWQKIPARLTRHRQKVHHQTLAEFRINESTRVVIVDKDTEAGLLIGEIDTSAEFKLDKANDSDNLETPSNYTVYLISRHKNHIAILLDVEEIDFEPIINCEYQEVRFGIVGEISKQLVNKRENASALYGDEVDNSGDEATGESTATTSATMEPPKDESEDNRVGTAGEDEATAPLSASEAMTMLLNSPLNKTILGESLEVNDFKIIDTTIDYLYRETCKSIAENSTSSARTKANQQRLKNGSNGAGSVGNNEHGSSSRLHRKDRARNRSTKQKRAHKRSRKESQCQQNDRRFRSLFAKGLNEFFDWDDFKIVCGKTKQMIIPMRSLKISVYSDEFAPRSKFVLRYRFISDASLLPALDNKKYFCRNRNVIDLDLKCNGYDDCGDASDESIKVCGYPSGRNGETNIVAQTRKSSIADPSSETPREARAGQLDSNQYQESKKLSYYGGDVVKCCQSNDWISTAHGQGNQVLNIQSLIRDSMSLFSGPLFAPTSQQGSHKRVKRIVGGSVAQRGAWPGQVSLQYELLEPMCHFCAGTLIHPMYVLTAGHCITKDGLHRGIKVVLGAHDLRQLNGNHIQIRYVDDALIYPGVDVKHLSFDWENDMNNDIALLRLNAPVLITPHVAPACLPSFNTPLPVNTTCRSIGWGQTHGSGSSNLLKHLPLKVVESSACSKELLDRDNDNRSTETPAKSPSRHSKMTRPRRGRFASEVEASNVDVYSNVTMVCVNNDLGHGICQGDSGGPLYCDRVKPNGEHCTEVYGVASFIIQYATIGAMCAVENLPGIFGEVSSKTEWISSTIKMFEQSYRLRYS